MALSGKTLRTVERSVHMVLGVVLIALALTPLGYSAIGDVLRIFAVPLIVVTGLLMWQHGRVVRALRDANAPLRIK